MNKIFVSYVASYLDSNNVQRHIYGNEIVDSFKNAEDIRNFEMQIHEIMRNPKLDNFHTWFVRVLSWQAMPV